MSDIWYDIHWNYLGSKEVKVKTQRRNSFIQILLLLYIPTLTSIDQCNIILWTITSMIQHTGMKECRISYTMSDIGYLKSHLIPDIQLDQILE